MRLPLIFAAVIALAGAARAESANAPPARPPYGAPISLEKARAVGEAAVAESKRRGLTMAVAVVEPNGALVWFAKMDDAQYGSTDVATRKAMHSAMFRRSTKALADGLAAGNLALLTVGAPGAEGGEPILLGGKVVGAIGVSGGTAQQDGQVAAAALAAAR
jgi:glc operon protein GlcG